MVQARSAAAVWAPVRWERPSAGESAPRQRVVYYCSHRHESEVFFAVEVDRPRSPGTVPRCGLPANQDAENPPPPPKIEPYKTHLAYVKERRSDTEAADILDEALKLLRDRRKRGEIGF